MRAGQGSACGGRKGLARAGAPIVVAMVLAAPAWLAAETLEFGPNEVVTASEASDANGAPVVEITDDGVAHALWVMGPVTDEGIYVARAPPGAAYGAAVRLSTGVPAIDYGPFRGPTLRRAGNILAAGWKNRAPGPEDAIWVARSQNMGATWEPALRADPGPVSADTFRDFQAVGLFPDGRMAQTWMMTDRLSGTTRFEWSGQDAGGVFGAPVVATGAARGQPCECCYPDHLILDDGTTVLVAYRGNESNLRVIHVARSTDAGLSFPQDVAVDSSGWVISACPATGPSLAADGATVLAAWMSAPSDVHVWLARSTDGGATWAPMVQVDDFDGRRSLNYPEVALRGSLAVVVWEGRRTDGGRGIFASVSTDAGMTFGPSVLVSDVADGASRMNPTVAIAPDSSVEVVWIDHRAGVPRVFRARGRTASSAAPFILRETVRGPLEGAGPLIDALLGDGLRQYEGLFGGRLPYTDPEPLLLPGSDATLVFYGFDDPGTPRIGVVKDPPADSVRIIELP